MRAGCDVIGQVKTPALYVQKTKKYKNNNKTPPLAINVHPQQPLCGLSQKIPGIVSRRAKGDRAGTQTVTITGRKILSYHPISIATKRTPTHIHTHTRLRRRWRRRRLSLSFKRVALKTGCIVWTQQGETCTQARRVRGAKKHGRKTKHTKKRRFPFLLSFLFGHLFSRP